MKKNRSKGVNIFAWLIIVSFSHQFIMSIVILFSKAGFPLSVFCRSIIYLVAIIISVYLLKLKNWARIGTIMVCILGAIVTIVEAPSALASLKVTSYNYQRTMFPLFLSIYILSLVFYCAPIYFFTRPKIKEQFK